MDFAYIFPFFYFSAPLSKLRVIIMNFLLLQSGLDLYLVYGRLSFLFTSHSQHIMKASGGRKEQNMKRERSLIG